MKIVLVTIGSLGDLHPFIAIGQALQARGHRVVLAAPQDHLAKVAAAGLEPCAIMPSFETIRARMGLSDTAFIQRIMTDQSLLMDQILMPAIGESVAALDALLGDADILVGSLFAFGAAIAAEKHDLPLVSAVLQPMSLFSTCEPPRTPEFRMMAASAGSLGRHWNRLVYRAMRGLLRRRYAAKVDAVRAAHGLPSSRDVLLLDQHRRSALTLCCYSPLFAPLPPDAPPQAQAVGFPIFDSASGAPERLDSRLDAFLDAGPAPLVFTLGSFAVHAPGNFYAEATQIANALGHRAVLLTGDGTVPRSEGDLFICPYAPHSLLFPRAAAIVHHGGIGTTGQALRAGKPQLVVPHMSDQYDNARRIVGLGVGRSVPAREFTARKVAPILAALLDDTGCQVEAARIGDLIANEDGAAAAARAIEQARLSSPR